MAVPRWPTARFPVVFSDGPGRGARWAEVERAPPKVDTVYAIFDALIGREEGVLAQVTPGLAGARKAWKDADAEEAFWHDHYAEFLQKYPEQFVAVLRGEVIAVGADLFEIAGLLESKAIAPASVWHRFITANPERMIL